MGLKQWLSEHCGDKFHKAYNSLYHIFSRANVAIGLGGTGMYIAASSLGAQAAGVVGSSLHPFWWITLPLGFASFGGRKLYDWAKYGRHAKIVWNKDLKGQYDEWDCRKMEVKTGANLIEIIDSLGNVTGYFLNQTRSDLAEYKPVNVDLVPGQLKGTIEVTQNTQVATLDSNTNTYTNIYGDKYKLDNSNADPNTGDGAKLLESNTNKEVAESQGGWFVNSVGTLYRNISNQPETLILQEGQPLQQVDSDGKVRDGFFGVEDNTGQFVLNTIGEAELVNPPHYIKIDAKKDKLTKPGWLRYIAKRIHKINKTGYSPKMPKPLIYKSSTGEYEVADNDLKKEINKAMYDKLVKSKSSKIAKALTVVQGALGIGLLGWGLTFYGLVWSDIAKSYGLLVEAGLPSGVFAEELANLYTPSVMFQTSLPYAGFPLAADAINKGINYSKMDENLKGKMLKRNDLGEAP